jgi:tRNA G18 (ribose-2'-O)-methylase SpoU
MAKSLRKSRAFIKKLFDRERIFSKIAPEGPHSFVFVLDRLKAGYNVPKIFRTAQAFGCRKIVLIGVSDFDPAPARGGFKQTRSEFVEAPGLKALDVLKDEGYELFILDPAGKEDLFECRFPAKCAFILGHEEYGINPEILAHAQVRTLAIPHWGRVQSLNVSIAASLVAYEYLKQHRGPVKKSADFSPLDS